MQSWDWWSEKGRTHPPPDELDGAPMGTVGAAGSGSGTGGVTDGGNGTTVMRCVGVLYHWFHASSLDAAVTYLVGGVSTELKHLAVLLLDILR